MLLTNINSTPNARDIINHDLQQLHEWAVKWHMSFNVIKTKYMIISNRHISRDYPLLYMNNAKLERVNSFQQLGLYFDEKLTWEPHINHIVSKANKKIGLIWKISGQLPRSCAENIYTSYIRPVLDYGCIIYDNCSQHLADKLEAVQRNAAVACIRAFCRTPITALLYRVADIKN